MAQRTPIQEARAKVADAFCIVARAAGSDGISSASVPVLLGIFDTLDFLAQPCERPAAAATAPAGALKGATEPPPGQEALMSDADVALAAILQAERVP